MPKEELRSEQREITRSFQYQGKRSDQDLCKAERLPHRDEELSNSIARLKLKIDNDQSYRAKLHRVMLNVPLFRFGSRTTRQRVPTIFKKSCCRIPFAVGFVPLNIL